MGQDAVGLVEVNGKIHGARFFASSAGLAVFRDLQLVLVAADSIRHGADRAESAPGPRMVIQTESDTDCGGYDAYQPENESPVHRVTRFLHYLHNDQGHEQGHGTQTELHVREKRGSRPG